MSGNNIRSIPGPLVQLTKLEELELFGNPLPEELFAALKRGVSGLFRYLRSTAKHKVCPRAVKLVLLGEPKSGKTTLLEALKGNPQPCDDKRDETIGVNVVTIKKSSPVDRRPMYLSAWDFAGQHMEHATHQFFLTENALYLILWNARLGAESGRRDLWYWLELLRMRVRAPKFLLVATHTENTPPDLNLSEVERSYGGCQGLFPVELKTLKGLVALEAKMLELAAELPSLLAEWPLGWLYVRDEVRRIRQERPYISQVVFRGLMKRGGVTELQAQKDLAGQLHDVGEILYFQDHAELCNLVILSPEWLTELIALVVRSSAVREHHGILSKPDLDGLWKKARLQPKIRDHLLRLMDRFDLTYSTGQGTDLGIVVEALPYSTPENLAQIDFDPERPQMEMIFRYPSLQRRLPPGIPAWGIARAHRYSMCTPWRDAAVFEDQDTGSQAIILASEVEKEVRLRVAADYPPFFFGVLEGILRDTFRRYPGAAPERRIPCRCKPRCPYSYKYETVLRRWHDGKLLISCGESGEDVAVESLLSGRRPPATAMGLHAMRSEMRRFFTEQLRAQRERMEKTCPSVFTLVPSQEFKQLDTWIEVATQEDELELALYCEHDSGWHPTEHSLYRFRPDRAWFDSLKKSWNALVAITKEVGPLAKAIGKASGGVWLEAAGLGIEKLPESPSLVAGIFSEALGANEEPELIDIETRYLLKGLIDFLDSQRVPTEPKNGGLHPYLIEDGRLLWLCPDHLRQYRIRG